MDPSLASVLGHLAQRAERQTQLQQAQNEVLVELARSLATDREAMRSYSAPENAAGKPDCGNIYTSPRWGRPTTQRPSWRPSGGVAEVSEWPPQEWAHRLLPLLTGEAQLAAHSLPAAAQKDFDTVTRAIRDRLGLNPEEHRCRFRALAFNDGDRPFTYAQQLRDQARRWLDPERNTQEGDSVTGVPPGAGEGPAAGR